MKQERIRAALELIQDKYILEAATYKKRRVLPWIGTVAAALALIIGLQFLQVPMAIEAKAVALAEPARVEQQPQPEDYPDRDRYRTESEHWERTSALRLLNAQEATEQMTPFVYQSMQVFLGNKNSNQLFSPVNAYIGLAMTAELTGGQTQQQLLDVLGTDDLEALRTQASALWEVTFAGNYSEVVYAGGGADTVYVKEGTEVSILANSLWLDKTLSYNSRPMAALARHYYASVYQQDLSTPQATKDIQSWLNQNTGNSLKDAVNGIQLPEETIMALFSTLYFRSHWMDEFNAGSNSYGVFHGASGNELATFMNKNRYQTYCYFGKDFCAIALELNNGSKMWFFLPDAKKTVEDILDDRQYLDMITAADGQWGSKKYMLVNLSVPQFDIQTTTDLREGLQAMGITHLFDPANADFSPSLNTPAYMSAVNQSVRVSVDEYGVTAAAYVNLPVPGDPMPPRELIDFILDRPFLFVITQEQIPLFAGVVNEM